MSEKVKKWFSAGELAKLGKAGVGDIPKTDPGCTLRAKNGSWETRTADCMGGKKGMRTEYQPPADVLALIHAFLEANPDFFGKDKVRAGRSPAVAQPVSAVQEPRPRHEVASPAPTRTEEKEEWMAIALNVAEHAIAMAEDRHVSTLDKVRLVNRLVGLIDYVCKASGDIVLSELDLINLLKPWATTLVDHQPPKSNNVHNDYRTVKERLREEKKKTH